MGAASGSLMKLRPVTFRYKDDPQDIRQYGLVVEEVEQVYSELVTYGADGKIEAVRHSMLTPLLLNEVQKQAAEVRKQAGQLKKLSAQLAEQKANRERELAALKTGFAQRLAALERAMAAGNAKHNLAAAFAR
ncbi:MAG TPA: tail fiber domain-containing protein [Candidatus Binataceae bacterium]|jgi:hypothetical protein|nr:tail fiber domain-containing protein [Candidatus Binataceae bacterium]